MRHTGGFTSRFSFFCLVALLVPTAVFPRGGADGTGAGTGARGALTAPAAPVRVFDVRWFNVSAAPLVPVDKDPVAQAIEKRFSVKLTLLGGTWGSSGYRKLNEDIEGNRKLGPNDARRKALPDVFPWAASLGGVPSLAELFTPLPLELIRTVMPRTWTDIQVIAQKNGMKPDEVWAPFMTNGVPCAIPQPNGGWMFPAGVLWRRDVLEQVGRGVPSTIEEWEAVFRAYRQQYPRRVPWTGVWGALPFLPLFDATGLDLGSFVVKEGKLQSGTVQPEMRAALQTLRRWYTNHYIALVEYGSAFNGTDTNSLFVGGRNIVTTDARPEDGSWVCEAPYVAGSLQDLTARRVPGAAFVMGPRPVFSGVPRAAGGGRIPPFGALCFGFSRSLSGEPEKLKRIMTMVDTLASDGRMYLTAMFGMEGTQWTWERTSEGRYPRRLASTSPANTGRYWIFPWSAHDAEYSLTPRVLGSISRFYGSPASLYGAADARQGGADAGQLFTIPYADAGTRARNERDRYEKLSTQVMTRFYDHVLSPMVYNNAGIGVFDDFVSWYHDNGGGELEQIVNRWAGR